MFVLDARLEADTFPLADWPLCAVRLMNDSNYPWVILVPKVEGVTELFELSDQQRQQLDSESTFLAKALMASFDGIKMNVAALGNVVKQLHIHHVVRYESDIAWPAPVWGKEAVKPYTESERSAVIAKLNAVTNKTW